MKITTLTALAMAAVATSSYAQSSSATDTFKLAQGKPDSGQCQFVNDLGRTGFDASSGRLWACGEDGWVYFESVSALQCNMRSEDELASYKPWKNRSYHGGHKVSHNGKLYVSRSWVHGEPGKVEEWELEGVYPGGPSRWSSVEQYGNHDQVVYMGHVYESISWSKNVNPAKNVLKSGWKQWQYVGEFECPAK
ncbi:hypothetical protein [Vibrio sonorensis]|uniref:hypothetical protein n=1 Tax=Vibrio sonorensis TaxID=1004316 RepID=UPI001FE0C3A5|nr:hypothetical protein [Vibrio sonorensis]